MRDGRVAAQTLRGAKKCLLVRMFVCVKLLLPVLQCTLLQATWP